jgi:hypothetical protein
MIIDVVTLILVLVLIAYLVGMRRAGDSALVDRMKPDLAALQKRLDALEASVATAMSKFGELQKDQEILDELEQSVMQRWEHIIEEKLGKRPVMVPCPVCRYEGGLEPNLLADEDLEFGCPNCSTIFPREKLRDAYPDAGL